MLDIHEAPEPINFEVAPGELRDYEGKFPENDPQFEISMPSVEREEWIALIIKIFSATRADLNFTDFFRELIKRGALDLGTINNFLRFPNLDDRELEVFERAFNAATRAATKASGEDNATHASPIKKSVITALIIKEINSSLGQNGGASHLITDNYRLQKGFLEHRKNFNNISLRTLFTSP